MNALTKPTQEDARLLLKLVETVDSEYYRKAYRWLLSEFSAQSYEDFVKKYPQGTEEYHQVSSILGFFEVCGVLVSHKLLSEDIFFDLSFGLDLVWHKVGPIVPGWQKEAGPAIWENAIWLHQRFQAWSKTVWKPGLKWKLKSTGKK